MLGILPLARPTFDVPFAELKLKAMLRELDGTGHEIVGPRGLLMDAASARRAIGQLDAANVDGVLVLQVTFTDAGMAVAAATALDKPLSIRAVPEPRVGGRLRLNSFCGLNLASHALGLNGREFSWLYRDPDHDMGNLIEDLVSGKSVSRRLKASPVPAPSNEGERIARAIQGRKIARIGEHPAGFDTCAYRPDALSALAGIEVEALELSDLFDAARAAPAETTGKLRAEIATQVSGLDAVDQAELDRSLRLKVGLETLRAQGGYDAFAIRCWPETFTEYGGAVCGPAALMGEQKIPCACEADVYGALTQMILQEAAGAPVILTDLVDIDLGDNTGVIWHCGQAPYSMRDPQAEATATIHTNRKAPLLYQFPLRPGVVTYLRISQAFNTQQMVLGYGEMLRRPLAFAGTSGVIRFSRDAGDVMHDVISGGLEHHIAIAYGDHRATLRGVAGALGLPIVEL